MTGLEFKLWRRRLGISQAAAAQRLEVSISYVQRAERQADRHIKQHMSLACAALEHLPPAQAPYRYQG